MVFYKINVSNKKNEDDSSGCDSADASKVCAGD